MDWYTAPGALRLVGALAMVGEGRAWQVRGRAMKRLGDLVTNLRRWPLLAGIGVIAAVALFAGAVVHDPQGLFGQVSAAWLQAVGSVAAILAAIAIDQGSARRQREQFDHAEMLRKRDRVETAMAAASLAGFAMRWAENTQSDLKKWPGDHALAGPMYRKWVDVATEHHEALAAIRGRVSDPLLLTYIVTFMHSLRPPPRDIIGRDEWEKLVDEATFSMRPPFDRLSAYVQAVADEADVPMEILFGVD
jgi:hypothetical protein